MNRPDLIQSTLTEASDLLRKKEVSSHELTEATLDRIETVDETIQSFVTVTKDLALSQAKAADARISKGDIQPLTGIPMMLKDNICTKKVPTTCSSHTLKGFVPTYDATVTRRLYEAGAVLIGKGNMDEFAMGSSTERSAFFPTRNPWDTSRVPGGSSGGPAAAVSAKECFYALGSDTGGSIRQPAALCGVVGLKPTYGLVSRYGLIAFASSLDQIGPITRTVTDSATVLNAISGHDPQDSTSLLSDKTDYTKLLGQSLKGLRIGIPEEYFGSGIHKSVENTVKSAIKMFEDLGALIQKLSLPHTSSALAVYYIIAPSEASANLARYDGVKYGFSTEEATSMWDALEKTRADGFGPEVKRRIMLGTYALSAGYYDAYYLKAQKVRTLIRAEFKDAFRNLDLIVTPTSPSVAFTLGEKTQDPIQMYLNDIFTQPANIAGLPAISIPCGMVDSLPVGLQLTANHLNEKTLFQAAYAYEQSTSWHKLSPIA